MVQTWKSEGFEGIIAPEIGADNGVKRTFTIRNCKSESFESTEIVWKITKVAEK